MCVYFLYCSFVFRRTFASETSQFLAPYEVSQKNRNVSKVGAVNSPPSPTQPMGSSFSSEHSVMMTQHSLPPVSTTMTRPTTLAPSLSNTELTNAGITTMKTIRNEVAKWNPFEDPTPFSQMTEDHIFDAEFDAIRQRGSQSSEYHSYYSIIKLYVIQYER